MMPTNKKTNQQIAYEVLMGKWGNGADRRNWLSEAGYDYQAVQSIVNAIVEGRDVPAETIQNSYEVRGTEVMDIEVDLYKYKGINLSFTFGGEENA